MKHYTLYILAAILGMLNIQPANEYMIKYAIKYRIVFVFIF